MIGDFEQVRVKLSTGVELDVAITGPADAPPLILLHGFPESHRTWRYVMAHFADRFRLHRARPARLLRARPSLQARKLYRRRI